MFQVMKYYLANVLAIASQALPIPSLSSVDRHISKYVFKCCKKKNHIETYKTPKITNV